MFDVVEMFYHDIQERRSEFQAELNQAMQDEKCPWLLCDGCFFQMDSAFLQEHVMRRTHELLAAARFEGALDEFVEARNDLVGGDYKGAIHNSAKAFESTLKAIEGVSVGNAKALIDGLKQTTFYEGFPEALIPSLGDQVLMAVPHIRNKLGGHGQPTCLDNRKSTKILITNIKANASTIHGPARVKLKHAACQGLP